MKENLWKVLATLIIWIVSAIPVYAFLILKAALSPEGFWQNFVVYGAGVWLLGAIQLVFAALAIYATIVLWLD